MPGNRVSFALVLHAHQPTGNFDFVFRENFDKCYRPLLDTIGGHGGVPVGLHFSGILLEWLEANEPGYLDDLGALVSRGQVELLGGGMGEPILAMLTERDRRRQVEAMSEWLLRRFGRKPRGAWLTERVWEQSLARDLAAAGVEYTVVDDSHLRLCGLRGEELCASYVTEDRGSLIRLLPLSERLRYLVPFREVDETLEFLWGKGDREGGRLLVYGDDAEKFGAWPGTHEHVFGKGWLERFLNALEENRSWIDLLLPSDALSCDPAGRIHLPDASYREMSEWALPTTARRELEELSEAMGALAGRAAPFFRGAPWRAFLDKYPEAAEMHGRSIDVSRRVAALPDGTEEKEEAERELFRGQCNCAYWHGVFGGLYLPHLRFAVYEKLIAAEVIAEGASQSREAVGCRQVDLALDGNAAWQLSSGKLALLVQPARGGHVVEVDDRARRCNLTAGMTRREEAYHRRIAGGGGKTAAAARAKEEGLAELLVYDDHRRESLVDRFLPPGATLDDVCACRPALERGDFLEGRFDGEAEIGEESVRLAMWRSGSVEQSGAPLAVELRKEITLAGGEEEYRVNYELRSAGGERLEAMFGVEFNIALRAGDVPDRRLFGDAGDLGPLASRHELARTRLLGARDDYLGISTGLRLSHEGGGWIFPVKTVSLSVSGFESVYQSTVLMPVWRISLAAGERWETEIRHFIVPAGDEAGFRSES